MSHYGIYDYDSIGENIFTKTRKVIGCKPQIQKDSEIQYCGIRRHSKGYDYSPADKGITLDNAKDIICLINEFQSDVDKYYNWGIQPNGWKDDGTPTSTTNFNLIARKIEKKIDQLRELL